MLQKDSILPSCQYAPGHSQCIHFDSGLRLSAGQARISECGLNSPSGSSQSCISVCTNAGPGSLNPTYLRGHFPPHMAPCICKRICQFSTSGYSANWLNMSPRTCKDNTQRILTQNALSNCAHKLWVDEGEEGVSEHSQDPSLSSVDVPTTSVWWLALNSSMLLHGLLDWAFPFMFYEQRRWPNPREVATLSFKTSNTLFNQKLSSYICHQGH